MGKILIGSRVVRVQLHRTEKYTTPEGYPTRRSIHVGYREATVEVWIDVEELLNRNGGTALLNKSRRSTGMDGCVQLHVAAATVRECRTDTSDDMSDAELERHIAAKEDGCTCVAGGVWTCPVHGEYGAPT